MDERGKAWYSLLACTRKLLYAILILELKLEFEIEIEFGFGGMDWD
jgi:hypothetical protein